jgi:hypothetical protein
MTFVDIPNARSNGSSHRQPALHFQWVVEFLPTCLQGLWLKASFSATDHYFPYHLNGIELEGLF